MRVAIGDVTGFRGTIEAQGDTLVLDPPDDRLLRNVASERLPEEDAAAFVRQLPQRLTTYVWATVDADDATPPRPFKNPPPQPHPPKT